MAAAAILLNQKSRYLVIGLTIATKFGMVMQFDPLNRSDR